MHIADPQQASTAADAAADAGTAPPRAPWKAPSLRVLAASETAKTPLPVPGEGTFYMPSS